jgi:two-component system, NarL family, sensor histidine kinase UhpB
MAGPGLLRDLSVALAAAGIAWGLAAAFDLHERFFDATRGVERLQLDELPVVLAAFATCLALLLARRHRDLTGQLAARRAAEARAREALESNRRLARHAQDVQERERRHLAREVHDELGQVLSVVMLDAVALAGPPPHAPAGPAARLVAGVAQAQAAAARLVRRLRPAGLEELGLAAALEHLVEGYRSRQPGTAFTLDLAAEWPPEPGRAGGDDDEVQAVALTLYRVAQEALTNAARHAAASRVRVALRRDGDVLCVDVQDDGCGFDTAVVEHGFGLAGMRERVELGGGTLTLDSRPGQGTRIAVRLPAVAAA